MPALSFDIRCFLGVSHIIQVLAMDILAMYNYLSLFSL